MALVVATEEEKIAQEIIAARGDPFKVLGLDPLQCTCDDAKQRRETITRQLKTSAGIRSPIVGRAREILDQAYASIATPQSLHELRSSRIAEKTAVTRDYERLLQIAHRTAELESRARMLSGTS